MKSKYWLYGIVVLAIMGVLLISGCVQTPEPTPTTTQPSETTPQQTQPQEPECTPDWQCTEWSECGSFKTQTRSCTDKNNCGITTNKPAKSQSCTPPIVEPEPITITGSSQQASSKFNLESGLSIFKMSHSGSSNFIVRLLDNNGNRIEGLVNEIGSFDGSKAVGIKSAGTYLFDIDADGSWQVIIEQPRISKAQSKTKLSGVSQQATDLFYLDGGLKIFRMKHSGSSNFIVRLLDENGNRIEGLVNEIGSFDGSKAISIKRSGNYLFDIDADGEWEITIE